MTVQLKKPRPDCVAIHLTCRADWPAQAARLPALHRAWATANGFEGAPDTVLLLPNEQGQVESVWAGVTAAADPWAWASVPRLLPPGRYRLGDAGLAPDEAAAAHAWHLACYRFDRYKAAARAHPVLMLAPSAAARQGLLWAEAATLVRNLVNTPAEHMGPDELAAATEQLAQAHGARCRQIVGDALLSEGFPAIHAVGRAASRPPRLIELQWGRADAPALTVVGKGVCFDTGGLDIKSPDGMRQMKKDMGGAAHALGLAQLIMSLKLDVRLTVLIPAVENAIAGNAYRPGDVLRTRAGLHIEIGNTDAEGRVILCDALAYAVESRPELLIDMATLTGAARVALGGQLPALFDRNTTQARELVDLGLALQDPLWHMPLWAPYHANIESDVADIVNTGRGPQAGAIHAALFLADFVPPNQPWLHIDLYAWNDSARPGRPAGGEAQTLRTLLAWLQARYAPGSGAQGKRSSAR